MVVREAVGFTGKDAAGEVGDEAVGLQAQDLVGDRLTTGELGGRSQGFGQAGHRTLMRQTDLAAALKCFDEKQAGQRRIESEKIETGPQPSGKPMVPAIAYSQYGHLDRGDEMLHSILVGSAPGCSPGPRHPPNTNISVRICQDTHVVSVAHLGTGDRVGPIFSVF